ncbi:hypothetical protein CEXT_357451 [Caerostris extrusa]|uniref:Uncharacterized protein n=1 Tax=Caerostris extrusa TaxID=172846 RepID=A0AAV4U4A1_CAEEX|nr:hypothetical protein CEXT_357451 [Caerostris extrusa]
MTDESGGISSDDEISSAQMKDKLKDQFNNGKTNLEKPSKRTNFAASEKSSMYSKSLTNSVSNAHKLCSSNLEAHKLSLERNNFRSNSPYNTTCKTEPLPSDVKQNKGIESVSDDDAKNTL